MEIILEPIKKNDWKFTKEIMVNYQLKILQEIEASF